MSIVICSPSLILFGCPHQDGNDKLEMCHVPGRRKIHKEFLLQKLKEGDRFKNLSVDTSVILKLILKKWDGRACTGFIRLRIGKSGGLLWAL